MNNRYALLFVRSRFSKHSQRGRPPLPQNDAVLQARGPISGTCKSTWPSFKDYNGSKSNTSNTGVNNTIDNTTSKFASNVATINGAYNIVSMMNNDVMFLVKRTLPLKKNKQEPWGYEFKLEGYKPQNYPVNVD